jgi:hypothetical protein
MRQSRALINLWWYLDWPGGDWEINELVLIWRDKKDSKAWIVWEGVKREKVESEKSEKDVMREEEEMKGFDLERSA